MRVLGRCGLAGFLAVSAWASAEDVGGPEKEVLDLRAEVRTLTRLLDESRDETERLRGRPATGRGPGRTEAARTVHVAAVDETDGWVALDAGAADGLRVGHRYQVFRGTRRIGRVRVLEVRERISGAVVEQSEAGMLPQAGDRAALTGNG